jgi:predicted lactoylglutathione lyase
MNWSMRAERLFLNLPVSDLTRTKSFFEKLEFEFVPEYTNEAVDHGFMYQRAFADYDGHQWEVVWLEAK